MDDGCDHPVETEGTELLSILPPACMRPGV